MITASYVRTMAAYNAEMNRRLYAGAERLGEEERRRDRGAFWHSLHGTLVHILWGDAQWMSRFDGWERPATPIKQSDHLIEGWAELPRAELVVLAVPHRALLARPLSDYAAKAAHGAVFVDVKSRFEPAALSAAGFTSWRL